MNFDINKGCNTSIYNILFVICYQESKEKFCVNSQMNNLYLVYIANSNKCSFEVIEPHFTITIMSEFSMVTIVSY